MLAALAVGRLERHQITVIVGINEDGVTPREVHRYDEVCHLVNNTPPPGASRDAHHTVQKLSSASDCTAASELECHVPRAKRARTPLSWISTIFSISERPRLEDDHVDVQEL